MKLLDDALYLIIGTGVIVAVLGATYYAGKAAGENKVNVAWTTEKKKLGDEIIRLQGEIKTNLLIYIEARTKNDRQLREAKTAYEKSLLDLRADSVDRVRKSEKRADVYKRMSEGAESERRDLASHAAKLDRSLEEGRLVVGELQATIRQRDAELISLGSQILTDRKLINASPEPTDTTK